MAEQTNYLTETILTIQNEIQTSVDWMETKMRPKSSDDTTVASIFMSLSDVKVKVPLVMNVEQQITTLQDVNTVIAQITDRKGLLIKDNGNGTGIFTKISVQNPEGAVTSPELIGYIEMTFSQVER